MNENERIAANKMYSEQNGEREGLGKPPYQPSARETSAAGGTANGPGQIGSIDPPSTDPVGEAQDKRMAASKLNNQSPLGPLGNGAANILRPPQDVIRETVENMNSDMLDALRLRFCVKWKCWPQDDGKDARWVITVTDDAGSDFSFRCVDPLKCIDLAMRSVEA